MDNCTKSALPVLLGLAGFGDLHQGEVHPAHDVAQIVNMNAAVAEPALYDPSATICFPET